ncbi:hypothetical protein [Alkalitalea saponilacus]|uniref:DUF3299 domain-containing protein n=1 Tax=Alkalitalea saponilacus TaxID=889453 RepID=A0A1T5GMX1_9BACT|nr:hypothetical protein [Alkalitalea saponilacus]ASB48260.1 hypothetical protein CDL62_03440 [Alkalitalea saponilacus]SKC09743.1 hypothetical protein SAMN03080601_01882 [Alkalitalea saponilacus]
MIYQTRAKLVIVLLLTIILGSTPAFVQAQDMAYRKENLWDFLMYDVRVRYGYAVNYNAYFPRPRFGRDLKTMDGEPVTLKGFFLPVDVTGSAFVLSYYPMNMCFFCGDAGIETVVEILPKQDQVRRFQRLRTDNYISVKGKLMLNERNYNHLIYIIKDAELVEVLK